MTTLAEKIEMLSPDRRHRVEMLVEEQRGTGSTDLAGHEREPALASVCAEPDGPGSEPSGEEMVRRHEKWREGQWELLLRRLLSPVRPRPRIPRTTNHSGGSGHSGLPRTTNHS